MIISLISSVLGMAGGLLPDIFKEIKESREHGRELERMNKQSEIQLKMIEKQTDGKLAEIEGNVAVEEMRAFSKQMDNIYNSSKPIGIKFVDAWNALLRPITVTLIIFLFIATSSMYVWGVLGLVGMTEGGITAGVWTIGYGATYGPDGHRVVKDTPTIDEFEAGELLKRDMGHSLRAVDRLVVVPINENQRGSLVSFTFNLGAGALSSSTLIRRINSYQWDDVPRQFSRWIMAGGQVLSGLIKRRRAETELWGQ